jgi:hypothetical protein
MGPFKWAPLSYPGHLRLPESTRLENGFRSVAKLWPNRPLHQVRPMNLFSTRNLAYLPVSAIVPISGLYGAFNVEPVAAIATIVFYTVARARCPLIGCRVGDPSHRAGVKIDLCCRREADVNAGQVFSRTGPTVALLWVSDCDGAPSAENCSRRTPVPWNRSVLQFRSRIRLRTNACP